MGYIRVYVMCYVLSCLLLLYVVCCLLACPCALIGFIVLCLLRETGRGELRQHAGTINHPVTNHDGNDTTTNNEHDDNTNDGNANNATDNDEHHDNDANHDSHTIYIYIYICMCMCMCICMCIYIYTHTHYVCMYVCIYIYICNAMHIREHVNTPLLPCHRDRLTITSATHMSCSIISSGCSSDRPRVMVGFPGYSVFSGVCLFVSDLCIGLVQIMAVGVAYGQSPY